MKLIYPPIVDSTHFEEIENVDLPLVTICPVKKKDSNKNLMKLEYLTIENLLAGRMLDLTSWGGFHNLTYDELLGQIFDLNVVENIKVTNGKDYIDGQTVLLPKYGYCKEISNYSSYYGLKISARSNYAEFRVFITDRNFKTYFSVDYSSHQGSTILTGKAEEHMYEISLHTVSSCQMTGDKIKQDDFDKCINDNILKTIGKPLGCIPPWMSPNNNCNETYDKDFFKSMIPDFDWEYVKKPYTLRNINLELTCRKHCSETTYNEKLVEIEKKGRFVSFFTEVNIAFNTEAEVNEKVYNYSFYQFLVDVGSALGLWLGLSVLSIYDLWTQSTKIVISMRKSHK